MIVRLGHCGFTQRPQLDSVPTATRLDSSRTRTNGKFLGSRRSDLICFPSVSEPYWPTERALKQKQIKTQRNIGGLERLRSGLRGSRFGVSFRVGRPSRCVLTKKKCRLGFLWIPNSFSLLRHAQVCGLERLGEGEYRSVQSRNLQLWRKIARPSHFRVFSFLIFVRCFY